MVNFIDIDIDEILLEEKPPVEHIDLREHIALYYILWLEDNANAIQAGIDWWPLAGMC